MRIYHLFILACAGLINVACSSDSATANSNAITTAHASAIEKIEAMTVAKPTASLIAVSGQTFDDNWTTTSILPHPQDGGGDNDYSGLTVTVKEYMALQFDPTAENSNGASINLFGRIRNGMAAFCALGHLLPAASVDADGYPTNGDHTLSFTAADEVLLTTECYITAGDLTDVSLTMTVSDATDTTYYDKKIQFTFPGDTDPYYTYIRSNSTSINVATVERSSEGRYRTLVHTDLDSQITRMEYLSLPPTDDASSGGLYAYRLYLDEAADEGFIMVREGAASADLAEMRYALAGKPNTTGSDISLSMTATSLAGVSDDTDSYEACYDQTGTVVTDGSLCAAPATASLIPTAATMLTQLFTDRGNAGLYTNEGPTINPGTFTGTTMYTIDFTW